MSLLYFFGLQRPLKINCISLFSSSLNSFGHSSTCTSSFHPLFFYLFLQPYLSVMLNKGNLEVLVFTGSHSPRRVVRPLDQGVLNDGREHSLRIERLPGRLCACLCLQQRRTNGAFRPWDGVFLSLSGLLLFRWTRRPRGRPHFPTISPWTCTDSSSVVFPQRWSRRPTESTSHSRDVYGTWWSTLCT